MERRPYDLTQILRDNTTCENCNRMTNTDSGSMLGCIDTDYCTESPKDRNDGILTMAFVNMQPLDMVYPTDTAFSSGTLFPNIDKPFYGGMKR